MFKGGWVSKDIAIIFESEDVDKVVETLAEQIEESCLLRDGQAAHGTQQVAQGGRDAGWSGSALELAKEGKRTRKRAMSLTLAF